MTKKEISKILKQISDLLIISGENEFKARAYSNAARILESTENIEEVLNGEVKGIGKSLASVIKEIYETGNSSLLNELKDSLPDGITELLNLKGLGAKRIKLLYKNLNISSIGELEYACKENRLLILKGFGKKIQENILKAIKNYRKNLKLFTIAEAEEIVREFKSLATEKGIKFLTITGNYRRKYEVYDKLEFIALEEYSSELNKIKQRFNKEIVVHYVQNKSEIVKQLFITTGSEKFIEKIKIPEKINSEKDIFTHNNMFFVIPEQRELEVEPEKNYLRFSDIKGIFHIHTTYSDGTMSLEEIVKFLKSKGYQYAGISDHSKSAYYANGLNEDDIKRQHDEIDRLNEKYAPFKIFKGIESDILKDGSLDYSDNILEKFDFVIASVHSSFNMSKKDMTERIVKAIENPYTTILGHPTGRLLTVRDGYEIDMEKILMALKENNKIVEINSQPFRLDLDWRWCFRAKKFGIKFIICPDAHNKEDFYYVKYGINIARKATLNKEDILNCQNLSDTIKKIK